MSRSPSFSLKQELTQKPDLDSLKQWIHSFCIMRFDLEQGQLLESSYPPDSLTQEEEIQVSFNSFPDSSTQHNHNNRSSIHDCIFFYRFTTKPDNTFLYGYVFNRQRHDERLKRGGEQKSVVILSYYPYSVVFKPLLQIIGPLYFDIGYKAIERIASYISTWPTPCPGKLMELPIGNATLKVNLPPAHSLPLGYEESVSSMAPLLPTNQSIPQGLFHDADIFGIYRGLLLQLWTLWELLLIGEPILIIAPTPPQCSEAVACLVSLVAPLFCSVDFRPYFTIHDPAFARLNSLREGDAFPSMVLGVTNLFFLKSLRNIPHIVSVGTPSRGAFTPRSSVGKFSPTSLLLKLKRDGPLCLMTEHKEALWSGYSAVTKPDTSVLNRLIDAGMSPRVEESMSVVNNEILRRHFLELTTNFLAPFGPYFQVNAPSDGTSPYVNVPPLPSFRVDGFLSSISTRGVGKFLSKRMKSNWPDLYRRFLQGPNFTPWFQRRRAVAEQEQRRLWKVARMKTDMRLITLQMNELEAVDSFNAIEKYITEEVKSRESGGGGSVDSEAMFEKLKKDLRAVFSVLPTDMQELLLSNPQRALLLQDPLEVQ